MTYKKCLFNIAMERSTIFQFGKPSISMGHLSHGYVTNSQWLTKNAWYHDRTPQIEGGLTVLGLNRTMSNSLVFAGRSHVFLYSFPLIFSHLQVTIWLGSDWIAAFCHWCHRHFWWNLLDITSHWIAEKSLILSCSKLAYAHSFLKVWILHEGKTWLVIHEEMASSSLQTKKTP